MSKGLEALERISKKLDLYGEGFFLTDDKVNYDTIKKELKALEIISQNFRLMGNCLHARNPYAEDGWVFVKELEDEEELNAWKEVLL